MMEIDKDSMLPVDIETIAFDMEYANAHDEAKWFKVNSFKDYFGLENLSPV